MKKLLHEFARYYLPVLCYMVLVFFLFHFASVAQLDNTQLSLRFTDSPISAPQAATTQGALSDPTNTELYTAAFWRQMESLAVETDFDSTQTGALFVDGNMEGVYPANFILGSYPAILDKDSVAVSEGLAWRLWGTGNLLGVTLEWQGREYTLRGIFEGTDNLALFQIDAGNAAYAEMTFTGVDLYGTPKGDPRTSALGFATSMGLGTPNSVVSGPSMASLMMFMALVPMLILGIWFVAKLMGQVRRLPFWPRQIIWLVFLLALAICIPFALNALPAWVVPNKWSDLDAWSNFYTEMTTRINEWLSLYPSFRDVQLKRQLILQVLLLVPAMFAVTVSIRVWNRKLRPLTQLDLQQEAQPRQGEPVPVEDDMDEDERSQELAELMR